MSRSWISLTAAFLVSIVFAAPAFSEESVGTLTLDSLSFISFGDQEVLPIPAGAQIRFRFGSPAPDGSIPFTIHPTDVSIPPISSSSGTLEYGIGSAASGFLRPTESGRVMTFTAEVNAKLVQPDGRAGTLVYKMPFTTESVSATNLARTHFITKTGMRMVEGTWYVQLVGATVNKENAYPKPGAVVYTVISGRFDRIPAI